jgi:hypothetical protein
MPDTVAVLAAAEEASVPPPNRAELRALHASARFLAIVLTIAIVATWTS